MADPINPFDFATETLATFLAKTVGNGTYADVVEALKIDQVGEEAKATEIRIAAGQIYGNTIDDFVLAAYPLLRTVATGGGGGGEDLAATLVLGDITGARDINVSTGQAIAGVDELTLRGFDAANGIAGATVLRGGDATLGTAGPLTIRSGSSGDGNSAGLTISVPDCTSANTTAGALGFLGGAGNGSGNGSPIIMRAGTGGAGFGGDAGDLLCEAGTSGGAGSAGGGATFRTGPNSSGNTPGLLLIETPDNTGADAGAATFRTGSSFSVGAGGDLNFATGSGFSSGGNMAFVAGGSSGVGGLISFTPGGGATSESLYFNTPAGPLTEEQPIVHLRNQGVGTGGGEDVQMLTGTSDPTGFTVNPDIASLFFRDNASLGELWIKRGAAASAWEKLGALAYTAGAPKSAAYTAVAGEHVRVLASSAPPITMPASPLAGARVAVVDISGSGTAYTMDGNGNSIVEPGGAVGATATIPGSRGSYIWKFDDSFPATWRLE